jgi:hypothetical protein
MPVALLPYLTRRNWAPLFGIAGCVLLILTVTTSFASNRQLQRYSRILFSLPTMNSEQISEADGSAATRIVPNIFGARAVGISTVDDWLGHGTDADMHDLPASTELTTVDDAGVFHVWYNYGIIAALLLWWLIAAIVIDRGEPFTLLMLFLALIQSAHCNGQLLWLLLSTAIIWMGCCGTSRKI